MRFLFTVVALVSLAASGCNSKQAAKEDSQPKDDSQSSAVVDQVPETQESSLKIDFVRGKSAGENEKISQNAVALIQQQFQADVALLTTKINEATSEEEQKRLFDTQNPTPAYVANVIKCVETWPESKASLQGAYAALDYAHPQPRTQLVKYLLEHRGFVDHLLEQIPSADTEALFQMAIAAAPEGVAHAEALVGFKTYFDQMPIFRESFRLEPALVKRIPAEQFAYIQADRTDAQTEKIAGYLQTVIDKYADMKFTSKGLGTSDTFGEVATHELFELRNLNIGDVAPDIVGLDLDGVPFKLSDYRGKVVMLDFWGHWCPPCRRMYPFERNIIRKTSGLPFALIGVNSDKDIETARDAVREDKLPWRNFWNGPKGTRGDISQTWNVAEWPTFYLIDGDGVIRFKGVYEAELHRGVEVLMSELGHDIVLDETEVAVKKP